MKLIKLAIISVVLIFLLFTAISLFIPSHIRISKATNMVSATGFIYKELADMNKWREWHPALKDIPENEFQKVNDSCIRVRNNELRILEKKNDEITAEFQKGNGKKIMSGFKLISYSQSDSLTVQWYMDFRLHWYPWEKFSSLFYENLYGIQMEQGLLNLKKLAEVSH